MFLFGVLDEGEVGGGFSEMEDNAPFEIEPTKMGLEGGTLSGCDPIGECGNEYRASFIDNEAGHRDVRVSQDGNGRVEVDFDSRRLNRGADKALPSRLSIA